MADARATERDDGQVTLTWEPARHSKTVELQQDSTARFTDPVLRYVGTDTGSVITGLPDGSHYFRIRALGADDRPGPWSEPLRVEISFMERGKVIALLVVGGLIVLTTVGAILTGHFRTAERA